MKIDLYFPDFSFFEKRVLNPIYSLNKFWFDLDSQKFYNVIFSTAMRSREQNRYNWQVLTVFADWCHQLLIKIINCFLSIIQGLKKMLVNIQSKEELIEETREEENDYDDIEFFFNKSIDYEKFCSKDLSTNNKYNELSLNIEQLFNEPVEYEKFCYKVLTTYKYNELYLNNYTLESYFMLKNHDPSLLDQYQENKEKDLIASIAVYEAIVNLYVKRFLEKHPQLNHDTYLPALRMTALCIAIKLSWDERVWNIDFEPFLDPYIGIKKHDRMELEFLKGIHWNVSTIELFYETDEDIYGEK